MNIMIKRPQTGQTKETKMEIAKGINAEYSQGEIIVKVKVAEQVVPVLDGTISKIESGEIDLVKGTDIDKTVAVQVLKLLKDYIVK